MKRSLMLATACLAVCSNVAWAQSVAPKTGAADQAQSAAPQTSAADQSDVVIVTARRSSEDLQSVPLSVAALSAESLEDRGIERLDDLATAIPSFSLSTTNGRETSFRPAIRRQSQIDVVITQDGAVGAYVDEVYQGRPGGLSGSFVDMSSVQVLKGPQGTLFGKNTTGGAVLINTARPTTDGVSGFLEASVGDFGARSFSGAINLPLGDKVAIRLAGATNQRDGFVTNLVTGREHNDRDDSTVRASVLIRPTSFIENTTIFSYFKSDTASPGVRLSAIDLPGSQAAAFGFGPAVQAAFDRTQGRDFYSIELDNDGLSTAENTAATNITTFDLGGATLKNIFGYRKLETHDILDLDAAPVQILQTDQVVDVEQVSNEVLLQGSSFDGKLDWTTGAIYFHEYGQDDGTTNVANGLIVQTSGSTNSENMNYGVFAQGDFDVTDKLTLTAGLRYSWDTRKVGIAPTTNAPLFVLLGQAPGPSNLTRVTVCPVTQPNPAPPPARTGFALSQCHFAGSADFDDYSYTLGADYKLSDDNLLYVVHRRGYRSGGFNQRLTQVEELSSPFQPEIARDVEIGSKNTFDLANGGTVKLNAAAYYVWVDDIQRLVSKFENNTLFNTIVNAASAKIKGIEVDGSWSPNEDWTFSGSYSIGDATYDRFVASTNGGGTQDLKDNEFALSPKSSGSLTVDWHPQLNLSFGEPFVNLDVYSQSAMQAVDINTKDGEIPSYTLANLAFGMDNLFGNDITATVRVQNLFDEEYYNGILSLTGGIRPVTPPTIGTNAATYGAPRMVTVDFRYNF